MTRARSLGEAVELLARFGEAGAPLAGGTWVMRERRHRRDYVALDRIGELRAIELGDEARIGALATHDDLTAELRGPALGAIREAARTSAFPAVRGVATVGGNICAEPFPEADLVPAFLACEAELELGDGRRRPLPERVEPGGLVTRVIVPAPPRRHSWFRRLTVRAGGEYAVASVAVSVDLDGAGVVRSARLAVGSVEQRPRLFPYAAALLVGAPLDTERGRAAGERAAADCAPRDGIDAPAWYRRAVLAVLVADTVEELAA